MGEDELARLGATARLATPYDIGGYEEIPALVAEIRRLRAAEAAARGVIEAARLLDECWHRGAGDDAEHRALCAALDRYWLAG